MKYCQVKAETLLEYLFPDPPVPQTWLMLTAVATIAPLLRLRILSPLRMEVGSLIAHEHVAASHEVRNDRVVDLKRPGAVVNDHGKGALALLRYVYSQ